eukprot:1635020-Alexandrium_andersonii.AAC.2
MPARRMHALCNSRVLDAQPPKVRNERPTSARATAPTEASPDWCDREQGHARASEQEQAEQKGEVADKTAGETATS